MEGALDWALPQQEGGRGRAPRWSPELFPDLERRKHSTIFPPPTPRSITHTPTHPLQGRVRRDPCLDRREAFPGEG